MNAIAETLRLTLTAAIAASRDAKSCTERLAGRSLAFESLAQRFVVHFDAGAVRVDASEAAADATVRGAPSAVFGALAGTSGDRVEVLGDAALFEDFRASFRPHLKLPSSVERFAEDAGDATRIGVNAARSAFEGFANAARDYLSAWPGRQQTDAAEIAEQMQSLKHALEALEARVAALEQPADGPAEDAEAGTGEQAAQQSARDPEAPAND